MKINRRHVVEGGGGELRLIFVGMHMIKLP